MRLSSAAPLLLLGTILSGQGAAAQALPKPPVAKVAPVTDDYFGTEITDPYRWMEARPAPQFDAYLHGQDKVARAVLARIPGRDALARDIGAVSGLLPRVHSVQLAGGRLFYLERAAGGQIDRLVMADGHGHETVLVDPSTLGSGGRHAEIDQFAPTEDGRLVAYGISVGGSENSTLHVIDTATLKVAPDSIDRAQFAAVSWAPDNKSFFFDRLPASSQTASAVEQYAHQTVYRHRLGDDPADDAAVLRSDHLPFPFEAAAVFPSVAVVPGSDYALASISNGVSPEITVYAAPLADLLAGHPDWKPVASQADGAVDLAVRGDRIDLLTHKDAPRFRVLETSLAHPDVADARVVIPQGDGVLTAIEAARDGLYVASRDGATFSLHRLSEGAVRVDDIALPFAGAIAEGGLVTDPTRPGALVGLESWVRPRQWLHFDPSAGSLSDTRILPAFPRDLGAYQSVETVATAPDGTHVPLSIVSRKDAPHDSKRPTYLVGYGAYGISYDPAFNPAILPWLDRGGVYAVAHVRGGGELGQAWHDAGKIDTKQNTIHDFIAAGETLIAQGWTDKGHLGGEGTSAGGILIGGAITQRPDLFRAALIRVGATNTIREEYTAGGPANIPEFGTVKNKTQFPAMLAMDAYNNVRRNTAYPAVLLTGGAQDPRVTVWIPAKMTAKLQADTASGRPVIFRVEFDAGHGIGSTRKQRDDETADEFAFLLWQFGETGFQPGR